MNRFAILLLAMVVGSACSTATSRNAASATNYSVEVTNMKHTGIMVYVGDGGGERTLGSLGIGQTQRFHVNSVSDFVTISARSPNGTLIYRAEVKLSNGLTPSLTVR